MIGVETGPGAARDSIMLVGRGREQAALHEHLVSARAGRGRLVLIGGEAGIGKTALAEALCREAAAQNMLVLIGRCYDLSETPPYGPWLELFARYRQGEALPPLPAAFAVRGGIGDVASQAALFDQVQGFLAAVTARQPAVLLLDDLHWSDAASLDLLRFLARGLATMPLLVLVTYRNDELTRHHPLYQLLPALVREASAARIDLRRLTENDLTTLVTRHYGLIGDDTHRLVAYLHARSEGNPFFTGELLRTLEEGGELRAHDSDWLLGDLTRVPVPALLRQVIDGRLTRLSEDAQSLLAVAAVIGQEVPLALWSKAAKADEDLVFAVAEQAIHARIMDVSADVAQWRFVHALIREALYEGTAPARRRRLHRAVGETVAELPASDPDVVAHHFKQAGDGRAATWLVRAGERAERAYAWIAAVERYEAAARLMESAGTDAGERGWLLHRIAGLLRHADPRRALATLEEVARLATQAGDCGLSIYLLHTRGFIRCVVGEHRRGLADLAAAADGLDAMPDEDYARLRARAAGIPLNRRHARGTLAIRLTRVGRYAEAREVAERVVADAPPPGEIIERGGSYVGDAYNALIETYGALGLPDRAAWAFAQALATYRAAEHYLLVAGSSGHALRWLLLAYRTDDVAEWRRVAAEAVEAQRRASGMGGTSSSLFSTLPCLFVEGEWAVINAATPALLKSNFADLARINLGPLSRTQGDTDQAWKYVRAMFPHGPATEPGETEFMPAVAMQRLAAALALDAGDLDAARTWLEAHDRWLAWGGSALGQSEGQALWAQYDRAAGDADRAKEHAQQAIVRAEEPRQPLALLAAHRLLGELDTDAGRWEDATAHFGAALALADGCAAPFERALTLLGRAHLHAASGERTEARTALDAVRAICTPLGAKPTLARADALAAQLAATNPPRYPAGLSAREVEILRHMAAGRSNRDIADTLFLSERTVDTHVRHILTKTNSANRAAAFALRHGLA